MPLLGFFLLLTAVACAVHAAKTGRPQFWMYLILMLPAIGPLAYFACELLPEFLASPEARRTATRVRKVVDPEKDLRAAIERASVTDSIAARTEVAEECLRLGRPHDAAALYRGALTGVHEHEPDLMLGLARAEFGAAEYDAAQRTLESLRAHNPEWQSPEGHLLYARSLEEQGNDEAALFEYEALAGYFPGQEAKCRWAELLLRRGERHKAREVYQDVQGAIERAPKVYAQGQREWLQQARRRLAELRAGGAA
jgi:hypothetical protein